MEVSFDVGLVLLNSFLLFNTHLTSTSITLINPSILKSRIDLWQYYPNILVVEYNPTFITQLLEILVIGNVWADCCRQNIKSAMDRRCLGNIAADRVALKYEFCL